MALLWAKHLRFSWQPLDSLRIVFTCSCFWRVRACRDFLSSTTISKNLSVGLQGCSSGKATRSQSLYPPLSQEGHLASRGQVWMFCPIGSKTNYPHLYSSHYLCPDGDAGTTCGCSCECIEVETILLFYFMIVIIILPLFSITGKHKQSIYINYHYVLLSYYIHFQNNIWKCLFYILLKRYEDVCICCVGKDNICI